MNLSERARQFQGMIEWIEEGYPPGCNSRAGEEKCIQMILEALRAVRNEALEESAKIAESFTEPTHIENIVKCHGNKEVAQAIRSLREKSS